MSQRVTLAVVVLLCTLVPVLGQTTPPDDKDDVVRITTNLVQVDVVVTKDGKPVPNLSAKDFEIYEDGRRQDITSFAFISNVSARALSTAPDKTGGYAGNTGQQSHSRRQLERDSRIKRAPRSTQDETNLALISPFAAQDLEFDLNSFFINNKADGSLVRSFVYLDASDLAFSQVNDRHETSLEIHGVIFGDNGKVEEQLKHSAVLSLRENEYREALRDGLRLRFDMPVKRPGSYQVRIAVRDRAASI